MTQYLPWFGQWGLCPLSLFLLIICSPFTIEWGDPYIGYMGNRERGIQIIRPNLNGLSLTVQWIGLLGPNIISHPTVLFCLGVSLYTTIKLSKPIFLVSGFTIYIKYYQHFHICINILNF